MLIYHPVGTARMSDTHPEAVVDSQLKRARPGGPASDRRLDHADDHRRQHKRADDHDRRARRRPDSRPLTRRERTEQRELGVSMSINYHREGEGPPLVLLHGVGHHWQAWEPVIERLADGLRRDRLRLPRLRALRPAARRGSSRRSPPTPTPSSGSLPSSGSSARTWRATRWAARSRWSLRAAAPSSRSRAFSPAGFWTAAELRFCQLSLGALGGVPDGGTPGRRSARAHPRGTHRAVLADLRLSRAAARRGGRCDARDRGPRPRSPARSRRSASTASATRSSCAARP